MGKFLYPIYKLPLISYEKWWLYNSAKKRNGVLSDIIEGDYLVLNNSLPKRFNLLQLVGNTIQDGEPSPENEIPVKNVTGNVNVKIQNKNLLEITENTRLTRCTYVSGANTNEYKLLCTASDMYVNEVKTIGSNYTENLQGNLIPCLYGETIYFDIGNDLFNGNYFTEFDENLISLGYHKKSSSSGTYTPSNSNCKYVTFRFGYGANAEAGTTYTLAPIVCKTSDTSYVAHQEQNLPINLRSKNLFDKNNVINGYLNADGTTTANSTFRVSDYIDISNISNLTISGNYGGSEYCCFYDSNKTFVSNFGMSTLTTKTVSVPTNAKYIRVTVRNNVLDNYQLEEGTEATDYVPYYNYELCKIYTTEDYFIKENGKWYLHKEVGKVVLNGTEENWARNTTTNYYRYYLNKDIGIKDPESSSADIKAKMFSNMFVSRTMGNTWTGLTGISISHSVNPFYYARLCVCYVSDNTNTLAKFKSWLGENRPIVYYQLQVPTNIEITDTTLIAQLEAFSKAKAYEGQTIIYGESDGSVPNYKVKYYMKGE